MSDKIKVEVELDLSDLTSYRVYDAGGEPGYDPVPVSITEAVVQAAARQVLEPLKVTVAEEVRKQVQQAWSKHISDWVQSAFVEQLEKGVQRTNDWGEPIGQPTPLSELIAREIQSQLTARPRAGMYDKSVLDRVIAEQVNAKLASDLQAAFNTARDAMLRAAQEAGAQALRAAVTKAVGG